MIAPLFCERCGGMPERVAPQGVRCRVCYAEEKRIAQLDGIAFPTSAKEFLKEVFGVDLDEPDEKESDKP